MSEPFRTITVAIRTPDENNRLMRQAQAFGFETVAEFLQSRVDTLAGVHTQRDLVVRMHTLGYTNTEICEQTGLLRITVQAHLSRLGLRSNRPLRRTA